MLLAHWVAFYTTGQCPVTPWPFTVHNTATQKNYKIKFPGTLFVSQAKHCVNQACSAGSCK